MESEEQVKLLLAGDAQHCPEPPLDEEQSATAPFLSEHLDAPVEQPDERLMADTGKGHVKM